MAIPRRSLLAGAVAAALAFAFWGPLIHARLEAALVLAGISFLVGALLARRRETGLGRVLLYAGALLVANVVVLFLLAVAGAN